MLKRAKEHVAKTDSLASSQRCAHVDLDVSDACGYFHKRNTTTPPVRTRLINLKRAIQQQVFIRLDGGNSKRRRKNSCKSKVAFMDERPPSRQRYAKARTKPVTFVAIWVPTRIFRTQITSHVTRSLP